MTSESKDFKLALESWMDTGKGINPTKSTIMSIRDLNDWSAVEMKAQEHEMSTIETPKVPLPTMAQQLNFLVLRCGQLESRLRDYQRHILAAQMYFSIGATDRAQQEINKCILL